MSEIRKCSGIGYLTIKQSETNRVNEWNRSKKSLSFDHIVTIFSNLALLVPLRLQFTNLVSQVSKLFTNMVVSLMYDVIM